MKRLKRLLHGNKEGQFRTIQGRVVFMGGPGSGGGNSSSSIVGPGGQTVRGIVTNHFDEMQEKLTLYVQDERNPQTYHLREGATREQATVYGNRRRAVSAALNHVYSDRATAVSAIDRAIDSGMTNVKVTNRWTTLSNEDGSGSLRFASKVERDYIDVALNRGEFKRNY